MRVSGAYDIERRAREAGENALPLAELDLRYAESALLDAERQLAKCQENVNRLQKGKKP
jgi:multidrug resistance efflux pump